MTNKPNIIVFFTDQQRWDTSGLHGNPLSLMDNFDRGAQEGTHIFNSFSCQPVCCPARASFQTGMYATKTGNYRNHIPLDKKLKTEEKIYCLSPKGKLFDQKMAKEFSKEKTINLICGHFEGVDQRVIDSRNIIELSIGDFILSGGESAAIVILDSILRLIPGVIGNNHSVDEETFENGPIFKSFFIY